MLKNLEYDNSIPQFSLQEKFNVEEYFKYEAKLDKVDIIENFVMEFSPNDKSIVYILSQARKTMLVRNYEQHNNLKSISFDNCQPIDYAFAPDNSFVLYFLKDNKLKISPIGSDKGKIENTLLKVNESYYFSISPNSKLIIICSKNTLTAYKIN